MAWQLYVAEFPNGKRYFGITKFALSKRVSLHFSAAFNKNSHFRVHAALREYGKQAREFFRTVETGEKEYIARRENEMIALHGTNDPDIGYNMPASSPPLMNPETAAKISATLKGRKKTPEHAANAGAAQRGKPKSTEARANMSAAWERNREATIKRLKGRVLSEETRAKISAARKGTRSSAETRAKISAAHRGRKQSPERVAKRVKMAKELANGKHPDLFDWTGRDIAS